MNRLSLCFELLDDVVISRRAASVGGQPGLDYLPGAHLLGAVASVLYRELTRREAWMLFHSGKVRFGKALPLGPEGELAWPVPRCWHGYPEEASEAGLFAADRVVNLLHSDGVSWRGARPLPEGYVTLFGRYFRPRRVFRMKTALAPETGLRVEEAAFGYDSLAGGQCFGADVAWDEDVPETLVARLRAFFEARPVLSFGRSRSAQYGRVACRPAETPLAVPPSLPPGGDELSLWLLSDLAACDACGFSSLAPTAASLGLPPAELVPEKTFVRCRTYSPYNSYHRLYGSERQVITQGSVLTYRLFEPLDAAAWQALAATVARGVGLYRESGLGRCVPSPALLAARHPRFMTTSWPTPPSATPVAVPDHPLAAWLLETAEHLSARGGMKQWAERTVRELEQLESNARRLSGLREDQPASPGKSQWSQIAEVARRFALATDGGRKLHAQLFAGAEALCRGYDEGWNRPTVCPDGRQLTYREWLEDKLVECSDDAPSAIGLLAELVLRRCAEKAS